MLLILIGGVALCTQRMTAPFAGIWQEMEQTQLEVRATDLSVMQAQATPVTTRMIAVDPGKYKGDWLELTALIAQDDGSRSIDTSGLKSGETRNYILEDQILLLDVTNALKMRRPGDTIKAYGKCFAWDMLEMRKLPLIGKVIADEMSRDLGGETVVVFFLAKGVEIAE